MFILVRRFELASRKPHSNSRVYKENVAVSTDEYSACDPEMKTKPKHLLSSSTVSRSALVTLLGACLELNTRSCGGTTRDRKRRRRILPGGRSGGPLS